MIVESGTAADVVFAEIPNIATGMSDDLEPQPDGLFDAIRNKACHNCRLPWSDGLTYVAVVDVWGYFMTQSRRSRLIEAHHDSGR